MEIKPGDEILKEIINSGTAIQRTDKQGLYIVTWMGNANSLPHIRQAVMQGMEVSIDGEYAKNPPLEPGPDEPLENWFEYADRARDEFLPITLEELTKRVNAMSKRYQTKPLKFDYCLKLHARWRKTGKLR